MIDLEKQCTLVALSEEEKIADFDCGNEDLNDFFNHDAILYQRQLLGQTYFFRHDETGKIVCAFTWSPDGFKTSMLPNNRRRKVKKLIPYNKSLQSYPAFLIGRLGVSKDFNKQGIGSQLLEFIKFIAFVRYPNLIRFLLVDAYNDPSVLNYYQRNDFLFVFATEEQEREYHQKTGSEEILRTRYMFYDMMQWKNEFVERQ